MSNSFEARQEARIQAAARRAKVNSAPAPAQVPDLQAALAAVVTAIEPIAAYVNRTPAGNKHADNCAALINSVSDLADTVEAAAAQRAQEPHWRRIAERAISRIAVPGYQPSALILRCQRFLDSPSMQRRATLPLAQRMYLAQINSHHLGLPDYLARNAPDTQN